MIIYACDVCGKTVEVDYINVDCYVGEGKYDLCNSCIDELNEYIKHEAQNKVESMIREYKAVE